MVLFGLQRMLWLMMRKVPSRKELMLGDRYKRGKKDVWKCCLGWAKENQNLNSASEANPSILVKGFSQKRCEPCSNGVDGFPASLSWVKTMQRK